MTTQTNIASFPPDPRRLGDDYRYSARSDRSAFEARVNPGGHSVPYYRGNGADVSQRRADIPTRTEPVGPPLEQGRLFRSAVPRTEQRVGVAEAVPVTARRMAEESRARHVARTAPGQ